MAERPARDKPLKTQGSRGNPRKYPRTNRVRLMDSTEPLRWIPDEEMRTKGHRKLIRSERERVSNSPKPKQRRMRDMKHQHDKYKYIWQCQPNCQPCINDSHGTVYHWACRTQGCQWKSRIFQVKSN